VLRKDASTQFVKDLLIAARENGRPSPRQCPFCGRPMKLVSLDTPQGRLDLDYCGLCNSVWFDPGEDQAVPTPPPAPSEEELSPKAREALALYQLKSQAEERSAFDEDGPDSAWQYIPAILGFPVEFNDTPVSRRPWITWGMAAFMAALFVALMASGTLRAAIEQYGFVPQDWLRRQGATLLASFFLHGGVLHIVSNLYFFLVFADSVEDHLRPARFLLLLLGAHLAGLALHAAADPRGDIPLVGASGGIAGVLAYYAVTFPRAKLGFMLRLYWVFRWFRISAVWALVLFVGIQLFGAWQQRMGFSNTSSFGHLGGLAVGLAAGLWSRATARQPEQGQA